MIKHIPIIRAVNIGGKINTTGSEPLLIIGDDYNNYYVKNDKLLNPATTNINEFICHFLLKAWNINTPDIALINIEKETLQSDWGPRHKPSFYNRLAFGSKEIEGAFDLNELFQLKNKSDFNKLYNPLIFPRIGLFDLWVDNEDRPPDLKNVMAYEKDSRFHFLAIDNAFTFRTGAYSSLEDLTFYPTESNYILQSLYFKKLTKFLKTDKQWAKKESEIFYLCIRESERIFNHLSAIIPTEWGYTNEIENLIGSFLFNKNRNKQVLQEYIRLWK